MATRSAMARKTAGVRGKRITARQKAARRLNIAIARKHRKKGGKRKISDATRKKLSDAGKKGQREWYKNPPQSGGRMPWMK